MRKNLILALLVPTIIIFGYFGLRVNAAFQNGHVWSEMDWNEDGKVSVFEVVEGSEVGQRTVLSKGKECKEFFSFKDGYPIKIDC